MKCLDYEYMACKVFYHKTEIWEGFCLCKNSPRYRTAVKGHENCETQFAEL